MVPVPAVPGEFLSSHPGCQDDMPPPVLLEGQGLSRLGVVAGARCSGVRRKEHADAGVSALLHPLPSEVENGATGLPNSQSTGRSEHWSACRRWQSLRHDQRRAPETPKPSIGMNSE